ncbi:MAG: hypothetical protein ACJAS1_006599 [Oleiphilaceae bacterium]|jgi:hypothetical protein
MTNRLINKALFYNEWFLATHEPPNNKKPVYQLPTHRRVLGVISNEH